jgi:hypothetical protein
VRRWVHELFEFIVGNHGLTSHHGGELAVPRRERRVPGGETEPERGQHRGLPERDTSSEPDLARAVAAQPVSVPATSCSSSTAAVSTRGRAPPSADVNHSVTVVGYGASPNTPATDAPPFPRVVGRRRQTSP